MKKYFMIIRFVPAILTGFFWMQPSVWAEGPLVIVVHGVAGGNRPVGWSNEIRDAYEIPPANWVEVNFHFAGRDEAMISTADFALRAGEWAWQVQNGIIQAAKAHPGQKIMIVSHSWGTVATSIALIGGAMPGAELNSIQLEGRRIARWVTLASPLGRANNPNVAPNLRQLNVQASTDKPMVVDAWANIYDRDDPVSMQSHNLPAAENIEVSGSSHTAIWLHPPTIKLIQQYYHELEQSGGWIAVKVIRKRDNTGVADARVVAMLRGGANSAVSTDKQGDAIFEAIPIGSYVIEATPLAGAGLKSGRASLELRDGEHTNLTVTLEAEQQTGALKIIKSYRQYQEYFDVDLEFTSDAMGAAGPKDYLYFKLYGAPKREGPWTLLSELGINGNFPVTKERKDSEKWRLDRDRLLLGFDLKECLSGPTWFKVAQRTGSGSQTSEIMSEPLAPEPLAVMIEEIDYNRDSKFFEGIKAHFLKLTYEQLPSNTSPLFFLTVKLGQPDQNFVVRDIHVKARLKGQTRHQWGKENEERLRLGLPLYGGSFPVEITVDGRGGYRATRTITVEVASPDFEKLTTRLAEVDKECDEQEAREKRLNAEGLKKAQETLKNLEEKTPEGDKKYLNYRGDHAGQLIAIDHYSNPTGPYASLASRCGSKRDVAASILQWELALSLGLKQTETDRLYRQACLAEQVRALDISRAHGINVETPREKQCQVMKHHSDTKESDEYWEHLKSLLILARQAGRYDLYSSLAAEYVAARKWKSAVRHEYVEIYSGYSAEEKGNEFKRLEKEYDEDLCKLFEDLAEAAANLTGDRELAASYYLSHLSKSAQLYAALSKKSQEQYIQDELRYPPLWWPKKPKKEIKPAELPPPPKSMKELSAAAPTEQTTATSPAATRTGATTISRDDFEPEKIKASPAKAAEAFKRGTAFAQAGRWTEAEPELREAVRFDSANGEYQLWLGNACGNLQKWDDAERAYRECIRLTPNNPQGHSGLGWVLSTRAQWPECATAYQEATRLDPQNSTFHYYLGNTYNWQKKWPEAAAAYKDAARLNPTNSAYHFALGQALGWQGKWSEAQAAYEKAIRLDPKDAAMHDALGSSYYNQKKLADAEAQYREAIRLNPAYGGFHANLAGVLLSQNRRDEALVAAKEAIRLGFRQHWVYAQLGINP